MSSCGRGINNGSKDVGTSLESLLSKPDPFTWSDNRKLQLKLMKKADQRKKAIAGDKKTSTSPLGPRPSLDAEHLPMPKPKPDQA